MNKISKWLQRCSEHDICSQWPRLTNTSDYLPTRLLQIEATSEIPRVRLVHTSDLSSCKASYATLSHCWGDCLPMRLTTETIESSSVEIDWHSLPRTFQEAIHTTVRLGIKYIWIDVGQDRGCVPPFSSELSADSSFLGEGTLYHSG